MWVWALLGALLAVGCAVSPLAIGEGYTQNEVTLRFDSELRMYIMSFNALFRYTQGTPFSLCFRQRPLSFEGGFCGLSNSTGHYDCLGIIISLDLQFFKWTMSADYTTKSDVETFTSSSATSSGNEAPSLAIEGKVGDSNDSFSFVAEPSSIYEVISTLGFDYYEAESPVKVNYMNTFASQFGIDTDNLLMQRQVLCYTYGDYVNLLFVGGVARNSYPYYFAAFISFEKNRDSFRQWVGLSLSKDKVRRDMLGVNPSSGKAADLYSLYASAPFADTSENVGGTEDWEVESSSEMIQLGWAGWFYYTQLSRLYETGDSKGDETIRFKIDNKYCLAAYFSSDTFTDVDSSDKSFKHQLLECFTPDLTLFELDFPLLFALLPLLALC